jgi:hypothetical protein
MHQVLVVGVGIAMPVAAFAWDGPLYIKVISVCLGLCAPVYLYGTRRTFIDIDARSVTMRGVRGPAVTFVPGDTTVKVTQAASGLLSVAPVVVLRRLSDDCYAAAPLASFSRQSRRVIPARLRAVLRSE